MKTIAIISLVVCSFLLFDATSAHPLADSEVASDEVSLIDPVPAQRPSKDIIIDASIQAQAHVVVPGSVAEELVKIIAEAFQTQNSGKVNGPQSRSKRITCDLLDASGWSKTLCAVHCIALGHRGGYCNGKSICQCRD
uniref:Defensin n=1 Tax=Bactrocera dorsalis TaxID=27457 RepID=A0A034VQ96_BACDO